MVWYRVVSYCITLRCVALRCAFLFFTRSSYPSLPPSLTHSLTPPPLSLSLFTILHFTLFTLFLFSFLFFLCRFYLKGTSQLMLCIFSGGGGRTHLSAFFPSALVLPGGSKQFSIYSCLFDSLDHCIAGSGSR